MKMPQNYMNFGGTGDPATVGQGIYSGLSATQGGFNNVAEFEIYDRKFKQ